MAGTSVSTVAKALKDHPRVAGSTRARIQELAQELGYSAHGGARAIATGRTSTLGVLIDVRLGLQSASRQKVLTGVARACLRLQKNLMLVIYGEEDLPRPRMFEERVCDGIIIAFRCESAVLDHLRRTATPWCYAYSVESDEDSCVLADDENGIRQMVSHLAALGHRRIAYVNKESPNPVNMSIEARVRGYVRAMADLGCAPYAGFEKLMPPQERTRELLAFRERPTAFVCYDDAMAMSTMLELDHHGVRIPEDASVAGINDEDLGVRMAPPLTTLRLPFQEIGEEAVRVLVERIDHGDLAPQRIVIPGKLIVRRSTGPAPEAGRARSERPHVAGEREKGGEVSVRPARGV